MREIPCPLCASAERTVVCSKVRNGQPFNCVRCVACGFHYVSPEPGPDELLEFYDEAYRDGHGDIWHGLEDDLNRRVIADLQRRGVRSVVDLGAGQGRFVRMARDAGLGATGVEPAADSCRLARETYGVELRPLTVQAFLEESDEPLEAVTMLNVLEHLPDPVGVLGDLGRRLRPGGTLAVVVPNVDFTLALGRIRRLAGFRDVYMLESRRFTQQGFDPPIHLSSFSAPHLRRAVEAAGLRVDSLTQAPVIRSASPLMQAAKQAVALAGRTLELATRGRLVWGYSLLCLATKPPATPEP